MSAPLRSDVSRQQSRLFNDLQGHRVPNSATAFDKCRRIVLKEKIPLTKGRLPEASREVERVRFPRADLQSAPGRLRASCPPVLWPVRGVLPLGWDRKARVTPGRTASQETWPGAEPGGQSLGERRGGAPKGERAAISARPCSAEYGHGRCAFSALRLPLFFWRRKISRLWSAKLGCGCVARTRSLAPSAPAKRGRGTTGARAASEPWWRGRMTRRFVAVAGQCHQTSLNNLRSEMIWSNVSSAYSRHHRNHGTARAPSTTLCVVPLPRYRGAG